MCSTIPVDAHDGALAVAADVRRRQPDRRQDRQRPFDQQRCDVPAQGLQLAQVVHATPAGQRVPDGDRGRRDGGGRINPGAGLDEGLLHGGDDDPDSVHWLSFDSDTGGSGRVRQR